MSESSAGGTAGNGSGSSPERGDGDRAPEQGGRPFAFPFEGRELPRSLFGYNRAAADALFDEVFAFAEELWHRCAALQKDLEQLAAEAAKRGDIERSLADALLVAQREAHAIREEARREAEQTVESARRKAGKIAEGAEETARRQARAIVDSAARERDLILEDVERARAFADETHDDLSVLLQSALKWFERGTKGRKQAELQPPTG